MSICRRGDVQRIHLSVGDHGKPLLCTLRDRTKAALGAVLDARNPETWKPYDLSRVRTIHATVHPPDGSDPVLLGATRRAPYAAGVVHLTWSGEVFALPGQYPGEVRMEYLDGSIETVTPRILFIVRRDS
ncbi:hypothetical protein SIID45300_02381 [Candidatus Magnetaquicoccaceae bacterium FCR-1]|uniref:Uncharacterized protein n=1 Tax=Candidatus Magnetaquiglobus chichijimensis TaxID=3141448 RepID=A0ABQ0CAY5_9PROT